MRCLVPFTVSVCILAALVTSGCNSQPYMTAERLERGLIIVLTGIEGRSRINEGICKGLAEGGVDWAIKLEDWTSPLSPLYNLRAEQANRTKAEDIARRIELYQIEHPDKPVLLIGQSGGAAVAAWAAESLPAGRTIDGIIMLAPSLSPGYMLDWALKRCRRGIISFYSKRDWVFLGLGTTITGTMDGYHTSSAGRQGFEVPTDPDRAKLYDRLFQIAWGKWMSKTGYRGGHLTSGAAGFVREYVVPFVAAERWDRQLVEAITGPPPQPAPLRMPASRPAEPIQTPASVASPRAAGVPATTSAPSSRPSAASAPAGPGCAR